MDVDSTSNFRHKCCNDVVISLRTYLSHTECIHHSCQAVDHSIHILYHEIDSHHRRTASRNQASLAKVHHPQPHIASVFAEARKGSIHPATSHTPRTRVSLHNPVHDSEPHLVLWGHAFCVSEKACINYDALQGPRRRVFSHFD